jgi:hypothetical protein
MVLVTITNPSYGGSGSSARSPNLRAHLPEGETPMSAMDGATSLVGGGYYSAAMPNFNATTDYAIAAAPPTPAAASPTTQNAALAYQQPVANAAAGAAATGGGGAGTAPVEAALKQCIDAVNQITQILQADPQLLAALGGGAASGGGGTSGMSAECAAMPCCAGMADATQGAEQAGDTGAAAAPTTNASRDAAAGAAQASSATTAPSLSPTDTQLAARIDDKLLKGTGLAGKGGVIVAAARKYQVPVDFLLAIYRKEASYAKPGTLADTNNNPGNLRFGDWQTEHGGAKNGGFTKFPTMDDGIRASAHLLSLSLYKDAVAKRDWGGVISVYAPSSENDTATYAKQMDEWTGEIQKTLGIDEHWLHRGS